MPEWAVLPHGTIQFAYADILEFLTRRDRLREAYSIVARVGIELVLIKGE
jgi:hypothetical protein